MFAHFLRSIADHGQRVGRQVPEQVVEVAAIERTTWDVVRRVSDDGGEIDVQRGEHLFQMVGAAVEILRIDVGIDRVRHISSEGCDEFGVRQPHWTCGLRRPATRHQLADCCSNALSLSHGHLHWLGLGPVARWLPCRRPAFCVHEKLCRSKKKVYSKKGAGLPGAGTAKRSQCAFRPRSKTKSRRGLTSSPTHHHDRRRCGGWLRWRARPTGNSGGLDWRQGELDFILSKKYSKPRQTAREDLDYLRTIVGDTYVQASETNFWTRPARGHSDVDPGSQMRMACRPRQHSA